MKGLIEILRLKPHIKTVWFNSNKDWLFKPQPGFEAVSTEEILKSQERPAEPEPEETTELQITEPETPEKKTKRKYKKSKKKKKK